MATPLCVIDMQPHFKASQAEHVVVAVLRQIHLARKRGAYVLLVEFDRCGPTDKRLTKAVKGYSRVLSVKKDKDDGSQQIVKKLGKHKVSLKKLRICGVNTNACVAATVRGLVRLLPQCEVQVVKEACNTQSTFDPWEKFPSGPNIHVAC